MEATKHTPPDIKLGLSMQSLVDSATMYSVLLPIEWHTGVAHRSGYNAGIEVWAFRIVPEAQIKSGLISKSGLDSIESGHVSYRSETSLPPVKNIVSNSNARFQTQAYLALPHLEDSLSEMRNLQKITGKDIPIIAYPEIGSSNPAFPEINNKLFQPSPDLMERWGVLSARELYEYAHKLGFEGFCLDTLHMGKMRENFEDYLEYTGGIHLRIGSSPENPSITGAIDTVEELKDLYYGTHNSDIFHLIGRIRTSGWKGRIVTEIPARPLREVMGINRVLLTPTEIVTGHSKVVENISSKI